MYITRTTIHCNFSQKKKIHCNFLFKTKRKTKRGVSINLFNFFWHCFLTCWSLHQSPCEHVGVCTSVHTFLVQHLSTCFCIQLLLYFLHYLQSTSSGNSQGPKYLWGNVQRRTCDNKTMGDDTCICPNIRIYLSAWGRISMFFAFLLIQPVGSSMFAKIPLWRIYFPVSQFHWWRNR